MADSYPRLFSPLEVGSVTIRNRVMQTAHGKFYTVGGVDSRRELDYQVERAKGGVGLVVTGTRFVHPSLGSRGFPHAFARDAIVADRRITDAIHGHGGRIFAQLNHFGGLAYASTDDPRILLGPSPVKSVTIGQRVRPLEPEEMDELADAWATAAEHSREGGYDGVEVQLAHNYLLNQFLSPLYNKRTDEYGGPIERRMRFPRQVVAAVRERVGPDFVVGVKLQLDDGVPGGLAFEDAATVARALVGEGLIDYLGTSAGGPFNFPMTISTPDLPDGHLLDLVGRLKREVPGVPVFAVGGLSDPDQAEAALADGKADMVALTRSQLADPEWANKAREGRKGEIYRCIRANQGCIQRSADRLPMACTVNPATGREGRFGLATLAPAASPRRWLVAGGGPAGMKAAETLARRGHEVVLVEREQRLGGQVNLILRTPGRETIGRLTEDLERHLDMLAVDVRLGVEATPGLVDELDVDEVLVATGATPDRDGVSGFLPQVDRIPGVERAHVLSAWDVLGHRGASPAIGERVVVLDDDATRYAAGVAEVLLDGGAQVEVVTTAATLFGGTMFTGDLPILYGRLFGKGLAYTTNAWATAIGERSLTLLNLYTGAESTRDGVDTVVLATAPTADDGLYHALRGGARPVHRIGDANAPRRLDHAIYEGFVGGRELWSHAEAYIREGELEAWDETGVAAGA